MGEHDAYGLLTTILRDVFERNDIMATPALDARDIVGWDSFKHVEVLLAMENALGVEFQPDEIPPIGSVGDLARLMLPHAGPER